MKIILKHTMHSKIIIITEFIKNRYKVKFAHGENGIITCVF